ncbi:PspA/IM30 family protein [Alphaproteobacteria bacterium]|nr:PspA/IM30 family protein [Alphaproteobacteria bacterium]
MLKLLFAFGKGQTTDKVENFADKHAITILRQQIRDSAKAAQIAKKALAISVAQQQQEEAQLKRLNERIADLEERTLIALDHGKDELARESAEAIANVEAERELSEKAVSHYQKENSRLKIKVQKARTALNELERGYRLADVTDKTQRLRSNDSDLCNASLSDAQATLQRLQSKQAEQEFSNDFIDSLDDENSAESVIEKLASNGCGPALRTSADDVIARLNQRKTAAN